MDLIRFSAGFLICHPELDSGSRYTKYMEYYVYILASEKNGTLYIGVTNNLIRRMYEHREGVTKGFTKKYGVRYLVYFESTPEIQSAIAREKQLKNWRREWKLALIEKDNPGWKDLAKDFL